jgi:hypothetical protein
MIALDIQPYSIVEDEGFRRLVGSLEPRFELPSRKYLSQTAMPALHAEITARLRTSLESAASVSFTTDAWTDPHSQRAYLALTGHWITEDFKRETFVLSVRHLVDNHTADYLADVLHELLDEWNLGDKVHAFVHDNASNAKAAS